MRSRESRGGDRPQHRSLLLRRRQTVLDAFRRAGATDEHVARWFSATESGSLRLDLWKANRDQLLAAGLRPDRISVCRLCTKTHHHVFESYRVDGDQAGRMAALIAVP